MYVLDTSTNDATTTTTATAANAALNGGGRGGKNDGGGRDAQLDGASDPATAGNMIAVALRGLSERFGTTVYDDLSVAALRSFAQTIQGVPRIFHGNVAVWAEASVRAHSGAGAHPSAHRDAAQPNYRTFGLHCHRSFCLVCLVCVCVCLRVCRREVCWRTRW